MSGFPWWGYVLIGVVALFVWRILFRRDDGMVRRGFFSGFARWQNRTKAIEAFDAPLIAFFKRLELHRLGRPDLSFNPLDLFTHTVGDPSFISLTKATQPYFHDRVSDSSIVYGNYVGERLAIAFSHTADVVSSEDEAVKLTEFVAHSDIYHIAVEFCPDRMAIGFWDVAKHCSIDTRMRFFSELEREGNFLQNVMKNSHVMHSTRFFAEMVKDLETNAAIAALRASASWRAVEKTQSFREWFLDRNERLAPALDGVLPEDYRNSFDEASQEEPEQEPAPEVEQEWAEAQVEEPEEAEEGIKNSHQKRTESADLRYSPEEDAARRRFYLPEGFTCAQLQERYAELLEKAPANQMDQVNADYKILLACCA